MQSLRELPGRIAASAFPRFFGGRDHAKRRYAKHGSRNFSAPRKTLRVERPTWRDKLRRGEAPMREARLVLAAFFALIGVYGLALGDAMEKIRDTAHIALSGVARTLGFEIREVRVAGGSRLTSEEITGLLDVKSSSALTLDVNAARQRFLDIPWIKEASVRLLMPATVEVSLVERTPYALWQRDGAVAMIDRDGRKIGAYTDVRFSSLPLIVGDGADAQAGPLLEELARFPALQSRMRAAILVANRRWNLKLSDGIDIKLPEHDLGAALAALARLDKDDALLKRDITIVDLRLPDRVIVRLSEGALKQRLDTLKIRAGSYKKTAPISPPKTDGARV